MKLAALLPQNLISPLAVPAGEIVVSGLALDSREVKRGDLFIALVGAKVDARIHIDDVIARGAVAVLAEKSGVAHEFEMRSEVPVIYIENVAACLSELAGNFYDYPSRKMHMLGVTGTNGKTSCSLLVAQLFAGLKRPAPVAGVIGTLGYGCLNSDSVAPMAQQVSSLVATGYTTPDAIALQKHLQTLYEQGAAAVAMEVTSIGLMAGRVSAVHFDTAVFMNLTQDHLDYHGTMEAYAAAKAELLHFDGLKNAIFNLDDNWAAQLSSACPTTVNAITYSVENRSADVYLSQVVLSSSGATATIHTPWGEGLFVSPFLGRFYLSNLLAVISAVLVNHPQQLSAVLSLLPGLVAAPGRMERVLLDDSNQDIQVIVDYAHTPDALEKSLAALHEHSQANIWTVFGCGGDRDRKKRPLMGAIAEAQSNFVIVTNDNPRTEDPSAIVADIIRGLKNPKACLAIADRAQAIDFAVQQAKPGDLVLVAGKGHENYQIIGEKKLNFSDVQQVRLALQRRLVRKESQQEVGK